jgi:hypothetical protein
LSENSFKSLLDIAAKKIEREHVKDKVRVIGVQYTVGEKSIPLPMFGFGRTENKFVHHCVIAESRNGNNGCYPDYNEGDHNFFCVKIKKKD